jgi:tetratricopeptide (TPR) repeat protein
MNLTRRLLLLLAIMPAFGCATAEFQPRAVGSANAGMLDAEELLADARLHLESRNFALAVNSFRRALRQSPGNIEAYRGMATAYQALGRPDLADRYYQEALARAPADQPTLQAYADMQQRSDETAPRGVEPIPVIIAQGASPAGPPAALSALVPRLERLSTGEVALITRREAPPPRAEMAARDLPGRPLPIHLVQSDGRQLVFALGDGAPQVHRRPAPLRILNAVGRAGQAGRMRGYLRSLGWASLSVGDATARRASSVVIAPARMTEEARDLIRSLPFQANLRTSPGADRILLVLGRDAIPFDVGLARGARRG